MSWWSRATEDQKLAQIDGAIECGLMARHVAMLSGIEDASVIHSFARYRGRRFPGVFAKPRVNSKSSAAAAYFHGEPVDMWRDGVQDRSKLKSEVQEVAFE